MIDVKNNANCCGCSACAAICPNDCVEMVEDAEGFAVPRLIDGSKCVRCGLCVSVCPSTHSPKEEKRVDKGFIVQNADDKVRAESASGGAFSAIASSVIDDGGIVYGAAFDDDFKVVHIGVETKDELARFRNSKYVQSDPQSAFRDVKAYLQAGRLVCYSGTPCQIEGLRNFLRKDYDNLLLVDVVCHGIGSPLIWRKYLEKQRKKFAPEKIYFRWKHYGYKYSTMSFLRNGSEIYFGGVESDSMLRAYFSNNCDRESCYACPSKKRYRISDFTIWDCFQPGFFDKSFNDDKGTTALLINSPRGLERFEKIRSAGTLRINEVDADELTFGNREMVGSVKRGTIRDAFLADASQMDGESLFAKYFPNAGKSALKKRVRLLLLRLGVYSRVKYALFLLRRKKAASRKSADK